MRSVNPRKLSVAIHHCPVCDGERVFVRFDDNEVSVRCVVCRATCITISLVRVIERVVTNLEAKDVYELSSRGALVKYLSRNSKSLTCSEYFESVAPGKFLNGVQCQDVQNLTYPDGTFDVCTATEVFEHVPCESTAFSEIYRVLKPEGVLVLTVPVSERKQTIERAVRTSTGEVRHLLPPEYHRDPIRNYSRVLAYRSYGHDIVDRLVGQGFERAELLVPSDLPWGYARPVVVAYRYAGSSVQVDTELSLLRSAAKIGASQLAGPCPS